MTPPLTLISKCANIWQTLSSITLPACPHLPQDWHNLAWTSDVTLPGSRSTADTGLEHLAGFWQMDLDLTSIHTRTYITFYYTFTLCCRRSKGADVTDKLRHFAADQSQRRNQNLRHCTFIQWYNWSCKTSVCFYRNREPVYSQPNYILENINIIQHIKKRSEVPPMKISWHKPPRELWTCIYYGAGQFNYAFNKGLYSIQISRQNHYFITYSDYQRNIIEFCCLMDRWTTL